MQRGCDFLGAGAPRPLAGGHRAKVIGNGLRELDGFLNHLLDDVARQLGRHSDPRERNTANKLRRLRRGMPGRDCDHARLSALARSRSCLFYCAGVVRRGDTPGDSALTTGWHDGDAGLRRVAVGEEIPVSAADLAEICRYYQDIAGHLLAEVEKAPR